MVAASTDAGSVHDGIATLIERRSTPSANPDRIADIVPPVFRPISGPSMPPGDRGEQRQRGRPGGYAATQSSRIGSISALEGVLHVQELAEHLPPLQHAGDLL
jgi:hypothetical protein